MKAIEAAKQAPVSSEPIPAGPALLPTLPMELGPYDLIEPIGRGGMGLVYLAKHRKLNKRVAIKLLATQFVDRETHDRFEREIAAAGRLEDPSIVLVTDAGQIHGLQYLVMEYVSGLDLGRIARVQKEFSIADVCEIGRQMALGLSAAHAAGMVHRDIKPANVMLDGEFLEPERRPRRGLEAIAEPIPKTVALHARPGLMKMHSQPNQRYPHSFSPPPQSSGVWGRGVRGRFAWKQCPLIPSPSPRSTGEKGAIIRMSFAFKSFSKLFIFRHFHQATPAASRRSGSCLYTSCYRFWDVEALFVVNCYSPEGDIS